MDRSSTQRFIIAALFAGVLATAGAFVPTRASSTPDVAPGPEEEGIEYLVRSTGAVGGTGSGDGSGGGAGGEEITAPEGRIGRRVRDEMDRKGSVEVIVILRAPRGGSREEARGHVRKAQDDVLKSLKQKELKGLHRFKVIPGFVARINAEHLRRLEASPLVEAVGLNQPGHGSLSQSGAQIGIGSPYRGGVRGQGVTVATIDSGVDTDHADLAGRLVGEQCFCQGATLGDGIGCCPNGLEQQSGAGAAEDDNGHGTNVATIIASSGVTGRVGVGVASAANLVAVKVLDAGNSGYATDWAKALDWVLDNRPDVRVVNMSLETGAVYAGNCDAIDPWNIAASTAINDLRAYYGTTTFAAAGNGGRVSGLLPSPACLQNAVAVGAVYDGTMGNFTWNLAIGGTCADATSTDKIGCFSNAAAGVDLLAPGCRVTAGYNDGTTGMYCGTSQAAPHAAGAAALLLQTDPGMGPADVVARLQSTGVPILDTRIGVSFPRIDLAAAVLDHDDDGWNNVVDGCPEVPSSSQNDADSDGRGDICDNCPAVANSDQADADRDGLGDACDTAANTYPAETLFVVDDAAGGTIYQLHRGTRQIINSFPTPEPVTGGGAGLAYSSIRRRLYFTNSTSAGTPTIYELDPSTGTVFGSYPQTSAYGVNGIAGLGGSGGGLAFLARNASPPVLIWSPYEGATWNAGVQFVTNATQFWDFADQGAVDALDEIPSYFDHHAWISGRNNIGVANSPAVGLNQIMLLSVFTPTNTVERFMTPTRCVAPGANGLLETAAAGDDLAVGQEIQTGPNGICETTATAGDDVAGCIAPGPDGDRDTTPSNDDVVSGLLIMPGPNKACDTTTPAAGDVAGGWLNRKVNGLGATGGLLFASTTDASHDVLYVLDGFAPAFTAPRQGPAVLETWENPTPGLIEAIAAGPTDSDFDGVANDTENCITVPNDAQGDADGDGVGDLCDNCPAAYNPDQAETDSDSLGDACDNCPSVANLDQANGDGDDQGDVCDACPSAAHYSPSASDPTCDNFDDDCDGTLDEDYAPVATSCGIGGCLRSGATACIGGVAVDQCVAGLPEPDDAGCDGIDDDCDGVPDDDSTDGIYAASLIGWWPGEGNSNDIRGGNNATAVNIGYTAGAIGQAFRRSGGGAASLTIGDPAGLEAPALGSFTIALRVREALTKGTTAGDTGLLTKSLAAGTPADDAFALFRKVDGTPGGPIIPGSPSRLKVRMHDATGAAAVIEAASELPGDQWVHAVVTFDAGTGGLTLYQDGVQEGIAPLTPGSGMAINDLPWELFRTSGATPLFGGFLDEVMFLDRALSAAEVQALYADETAALCVDADGDGHRVNTDCNDSDPTVGPGATEQCNNVDDDCDGAVDESIAVACYSGPAGTENVGICHGGLSVCVAGAFAPCAGEVVPAAEDGTCNAIDDDCSGAADEDYVPPVTACGIGGCGRTGVIACVAGVLGDTCAPGDPSPESCNNVDDDCNAMTDESIVVACYTGPAGTENVGVCHGGTSTCSAGVFGACVGQVLPAASDATCNNLDNDCDGTVDDDYVAPPTTCGIGGCGRAGLLTCVSGVLEDTCVPGDPSPEVCNAIDDDCDAGTDEALVQACYTGPAGTENVGACHGGTSTCAGGVYGACLGQVLPAADDASCNAIDNDCNGATDEGYVAPVTTCGVGACAATGLLGCTPAGTLEDTCVPGAPLAPSDTTCDAVDDDCDGASDEEYAPPVTSCGIGECARSGVLACAGGVVSDTCSPGAPSVETCDNLDNDCDGATDDGVSRACYTGAAGSEGVGVCHDGIETCSAGAYGACNGEVTPAADDALCNGLDDDCDAEIDEDAPGDLADLVFEAATTTLFVTSGSATGASVLVTNGGPNPVRLTAISFAGGFVTPLVTDTTSLPFTLCPGGSASLSIAADATGAADGLYAGLLNLLGPGGATTQDVEVTVAPAPKPDLTPVSSSGVVIQGGTGPAPVEVGESFEVHATIRNIGPAAAGAFRVNAYAGATLLGFVDVVAGLAAGSSTPVEIPATVSLAEATWLVRVEVAPPAGGELSLANNVASTALQVGTPINSSAAIAVSAAVSYPCSYDTLYVSGIARYVVTTDEGVDTFPVQGGFVTVYLYDSTGTTLLDTLSSTHTSTTGAWSIRAPAPSAGDYRVRVEVTDYTVTDTSAAIATTVLPGTSCTSPPPDPQPEVVSIDPSVCKGDITFLDDTCTTPLGPNPPANVQVCIRAVIHNTGDDPMPATPVSIHVFEHGTGGFTQHDLPAGVIELDGNTSTTVQVVWTPTGDGEHVVQVDIDPPYYEDRDDNEATTTLVVGTGVPETAIAVTAAGATCSPLLWITGGAFYDGNGVPVGCGDVSAVLRDVSNPGSPIVLDTASGIHSEADGTFRVFLDDTSTAPGNYEVAIEVTDGVLTGTRVLSYTCLPVTSPDPVAGTPPPPAPGVPGRDAWLYAEDITFLGDGACTTGLFANPEPGQEVGIFSVFHYYGPDEQAGQTVYVRELVPTGSGFSAFVIAAPTVDLPAGGGLVTLCTPWTPTLDGERIIQVAIDPSFTQYEGNDSATRAIGIGQNTCRLQLSATSLSPTAGSPAGLVVTAFDTRGLATSMTLSVEPLDGPLAGLATSFAPPSPLSLPGNTDLTVAIDGSTPSGRHLLALVGRSDTCTAIATFAIEVPLCRDQDGDGYGAPGQATCAAGPQTDCDDGNPLVHPGGADASCDGVDQDCSGTVDEDYAPVMTVCGVGACAADGATSCVGGQVADSCLPGAPAADDATCDGVDDDCSGTADEDYAPVVTACGVGACAASGVTTCVAAQVADSCLPGTPAADDATCDGVDDDCSGAADEDYAPVVTACGIGACAAGGSTSCAGGQVADSCLPGTPAFDDSACNGLDDDCDGAADEDFVGVPTSCGMAPCTATGVTQCDGGSVVDTCEPPTAGAAEVCDGQDNDCDGVVDEGSLAIRADIHTLGSGSQPVSSKAPYEDLVVRVYDMRQGSCARDVCGGVSWQHYACIVAQCDPVEGGHPDPAAGQTDASGEVTFDLPPGNYLAIGLDGADKHLGVPASGVVCGGDHQKHLQKIITANGKSLAGKTTIRTGSELLIIEPEYIEWTGTQELYPFVFDSLGDWGVTATVTPPEGFEADYPALSTEVASDVRALQFTITDIGSDWVPTEVRHVVEHGARKEVVRSRVGILVAPDLAAAKNLHRDGRPLGLDGQPLPTRGLDPRREKVAEVAGWIAPSGRDAAWSLKIRVNTEAVVTVAIVHGGGAVVRTITSGLLQPGEHTFEWDGRDERDRMLGPGTYSLNVTVSGSVVDTVRIIEPRRSARQ